MARLTLKVEIKKEGESDEANELKYSGSHTVPIYQEDESGNKTYNFRLTGIIVGGQRNVDYKFEPVSSSDFDVRFVYDSQVGDAFYLKKGSADEVNTLVLQTNDNEDLNIILEFEYTGSQEFKCLDGTVFPGTRFYLAGEVKAADFKACTGDATSQGRVFTQDYITAINITVSSLEKAYNVLPNILSSNLEIGVMTTPQWRSATPADPVILE